jgi:hypothetical protein
LIYNIFGGWRVSAELAARISKIPLATGIVFVICGLLALIGRRFSKRAAAVAMSAVSLLATVIIKDQLKFAFGRTWPDTWAPGIVSFVRDNVYGFHFFQSGKSFESFPSGHAAATAPAPVEALGLWLLLRAFASGCTAMTGVEAVSNGVNAFRQPQVSNARHNRKPSCPRHCGQRSHSHPGAFARRLRCREP